jgi:hypothetical protein
VENKAMDEELLRVAYIQMKIANEALDYSARCLQEVISRLERTQEEAKDRSHPLGHDHARTPTPSAEPAPSFSGRISRKPSNLDSIQARWYEGLVKANKKPE